MCVSFAIPPVTLFICDPLLSYVEMFYSRHTKGRVVLKVATGWSVLFGGGFAAPFFLVLLCVQPRGCELRSLVEVSPTLRGELTRGLGFLWLGLGRGLILILSRLFR